MTISLDTDSGKNSIHSDFNLSRRFEDLPNELFFNIFCYLKIDLNALKSSNSVWIISEFCGLNQRVEGLMQDFIQVNVLKNKRYPTLETSKEANSFDWIHTYHQSQKQLYEIGNLFSEDLSIDDSLNYERFLEILYPIKDHPMLLTQFLLETQTLVYPLIELGIVDPSFKGPDPRLIKALFESYGPVNLNPENYSWIELGPLKNEYFLSLVYVFPPNQKNLEKMNHYFEAKIPPFYLSKCSQIEYEKPYWCLMASVKDSWMKARHTLILLSHFLTSFVPSLAQQGFVIKSKSFEEFYTKKGFSVESIHRNKWEGFLASLQNLSLMKTLESLKHNKLKDGFNKTQLQMLKKSYQSFHKGSYPNDEEFFPFHKYLTIYSMKISD